MSVHYDITVPKFACKRNAPERRITCQLVLKALVNLMHIPHTLDSYFDDLIGIITEVFGPDEMHLPVKYHTRNAQQNGHRKLEDHQHITHAISACQPDF
ncbi:hypothetical protein D3C86_1977130 [compost metagenome]